MMTALVKLTRRALALACLVLGTNLWAEAPATTALLQHPIIGPALSLAELQAYAESQVPLMPKVTTVAEWEHLAGQMRREVLDKIVFRGAAAKQWREAKTQVDWQDTIEGGPGYHIKKLRYEVLPGLWMPALLYQPDKPAAKMPVHLAVIGHEPVGKAAPYQQLRCIHLAKQGVASLSIDWFGMGQLRTEGFSHYRMNQLDLCGVSGLAPYYLNMSRGLDILLALPSADARRVAVSGVSGGGWQTIFISSLDPRVTLCNPVAGYSSFRTRARFPTDLGDSEQTPNDLATIADYTHLTGMMAGRAALLTFNSKDNCCFATDHALQPLLDAAGPVFKLYGQAGRLSSHDNFDPGTHNYDLDNRQAFYSVVGEEFFPGDKHFAATEPPMETEVKKPEQLAVVLPAANTDFHQLALALSKPLPGPAIKSPKAARGKLAAIVKFTTHAVAASQAGEETRGDVHATYWKLRIGDIWTVPVVELVKGEPKGTTLLVADKGRGSATAEVDALLAGGQRVLALDPFYFGESKIVARDFLHSLLVTAVGDRPLGIQASEVAAVARWAAGQFKTGSVDVSAVGPRSSTFALVAAALDRHPIGHLTLTNPMASLHEVIDGDLSVSDKPELFCFGLLESFDLPQLKQMAGPERVSELHSTVATAESGGPVKSKK